MLEFYKRKLTEYRERKRDEYHAAYLAAIVMDDEKLAAKHLKEYENYAQQVKELSKCS